MISHEARRDLARWREDLTLRALGCTVIKRNFHVDPGVSTTADTMDTTFARLNGMHDYHDEGS
jgi:hypothetical protein